jgi:hypothetical protein
LKISTDTYTMLYESDYDLYRTWWKRSRPTTQGYQKCYQAKTPAGDFLQVESNFHEGLIKLQLEPADEKGSCYTCTIKKGTIIREREVNSGSSASTKKKFLPFKVVFSCLPDEDTIKSVGGNYGIIWIPSFRKKAESFSVQVPDLSDSSKNRLGLWQSFIQKRRESKASVGKTRWQRIKERVADDLQDSALGLSLGGLLYYHYFDFMVLGWVLAVLGILFGGLDWAFRKREPLLAKVLLFFLAGSYFFYTGYTQY